MCKIVFINCLFLTACVCVVFPPTPFQNKELLDLPLFSDLLVNFTGTPVQANAIHYSMPYIVSSLLLDVNLNLHTQEDRK